MRADAGAFGEEAVPFSYDGVFQNPLGLVPRADNTTLQFTSRSNLCTGPDDGVLKDRARANVTISADDCETAQMRARVDGRAFRDPCCPIGIADEIRTPIFG